MNREQTFYYHIECVIEMRKSTITDDTEEEKREGSLWQLSARKTYFSCMKHLRSQCSLTAARRHLFPAFLGPVDGNSFSIFNIFNYNFLLIFLARAGLLNLMLWHSQLHQAVGGR